ncbi:MAG: hypothetical protein OXK19_00465 [Candidatus Dadabacteria bacterium]|nr:hypothetical protein [Candidatus Dadabacteria bacterium]
MSELFRIYVGEEEIYSGHLADIPDYYRSNLVEAISEWGECLSKSGFRELHERDPGIDKIMMCIGLIDRVEMEIL